MVKRILKSDPGFFKRIGANGGRASSNRSKPISQYTLDGELVSNYKSFREAGRSTGIPFTTIAACINGRLSHAGGYIWKLAKKE